ncbi:MAG: molybdopterin molybdenumtransferase MoeA [Betaproteobacteria bacterium]|nr:molybdopterin molybdenumtransferase MoeA [Betaproteobacteria bacterium]
MNNGLLTVDEALARLLAGVQPIREVEVIATMAAHGRVLAAPQRSTIDVPGHDNSAMDGYAVRVADCVSGQARLKISQRIAAGAVGAPLAPGTAARIFTGAPMPLGADAVVMQEQTEAAGDAVIVRHSPKPSEWVRYIGEDIRANSEILPAGIRMRPQDAGLAASVGLATLPVTRKLRAAIFFTGDELVMPGEPLPKGSIYNSSRYFLTSMLSTFGCEVTDLGIIPDSLTATREFMRRAAANHDLVITSGGMSVGEEDHVKPAVEAEGRLDMWRIAMKPGKPLAFGQVRRTDGTEASFIGLPGNPVSSFICMVLFVKPFILRSMGVQHLAIQSYQVRAAFDWPKPDARQEFLRVKLGAAGSAELFTNQSSAVLTSTVWGDGLVDNPPRTAINQGDMVRYLPFAELLKQW